MDTVEKIYMDRGSDANLAEMMALINSNKGMDPMAMMAMMNNNGGLGGNNGLLWIFLLLLFGENGFGKRNGSAPAVGQEMFDTNVLLRAIDGNGAAINQLAQTLNCDMNSINQALCSIKGGLDKVSGEIGFTGERVINAIQAGNSAISAQLAQCCCNFQTAILNQTNSIQQGFTTIGNSLQKGFCDIAYAAQNNTRDIIEAGHADTQRIVDILQAQSIAAKDQRILELEQESQTNKILAAIATKA